MSQREAITKKHIWILAVLAIAIGLIYLTAPWLHWFWFDFFYMMIGAWIAGFGVFALISYFLIKKSMDWKTEQEKWSSHYRGKEPTYKWGTPLALFVILVPGLILFWCWQHAHAKVVLAEQTKAETIVQLPETTQVRYLPLDVAKKCAENSLTDSRYELGDLDPIQSGDELNWVVPRIPSGAINTWSLKTDGVAIVKPDCSILEKRKTMHYGEGMLLTDNLTRQLYHRNYWADIPEIYYLTNGEEIIGVAPYLRFKMDWWSFTQIPTWGGVFIINTNGDIEDLTPQEAQKDPRLAGQRIYPEKLASKIAESWGHRNGVWNAWVTHKDQTVVPTIDDSANQMPYLIPTEDGPQWSITFEPRGRTYGLYKMMFVNAHTGEVNIFTPPKGSNWTGVNKAAQYARNKFPQIQWVNGESSGNFIAFEPRPVVHSGVLYWMHSVTNRERSNVSFTTMTNASTQEVRAFCTIDELKRFLKGEFNGYTSECGTKQQPPQGGNQTQPQPSEPAVGSDLEELTNEQLSALISQIEKESKENTELSRKIADELLRRLSTTPTPSR